MVRLRKFLGILLLGGIILSKPVFAKDDTAYERSYATDLEKIVITPSKVEQGYRFSTQNISIITDEDIESTGVTEITEILDLLPSVDIVEYGSAGSLRSVHTRGAASSQVITLIDGRPINTPRDGITDFNQISLSNIERIEVLRGPISSIYGAGAIGGVINIITKSGKEKKETELLNKFGSFSTKLCSLTQGHKIKDFDYFVSYDYLASHGHRDNADYLSNNVNAKFGYELNDDNRISLSSGYFNSEVGSPGWITSQDLNDRNEAFKKYIDATYNGKIIEGQDITLKLFNTSDRFEFIEEFNPLDKDSHCAKVYGVDAQISQVMFDIFRTAFGLSYQDHRLNSSNSNKHRYNLRGAYLESELDFFEIGTLKLGVRWDDYSNFGDRLSPSISFNTWIFDKIKFHGLVAKSFRAPTFNDLYWPREDYIFWGVEGNETLGPEKAESYEVGISGYFIKGIKTDITLFKTDVKDMIEWVADSLWWSRPENISSVEMKGIETEAEYVLKERLKINFNYGYLEAENKNTQKWLVYRPHHLYKLKLSYSPKPRYEISLSGIYKTKRFANGSNTSILDHHYVINANFTHMLSGVARLLFEAKNILDKEYQEMRNYSLPGRAFYAGLKLSF